MDAPTYWAKLKLPFQIEDDGFQFTNPVVLATKFVEAAGIAAYLGQETEVLTEQLGNLKITLERKRRELASFRRGILAGNYKKITKSASSEIQEAFIYATAKDAGCLVGLMALEADIEQLLQDIESREPRLAQYKHRFKVLELTMGWGKQYLDFEKLVARIGNPGM